MDSDPAAACDPAVQDCPSWHLVIPATSDAVRDGLRALLDSVLMRGVTERERAAAEIVLAEVLNNIVEHAYAGWSGEIDLTLHLCPAHLLCEIHDHGKGMPGARLPAGDLAAFTDLASLPEGGYGWHMIRQLAQDIDYSRDAQGNHLRFRLRRPQSAAPAGIVSDPGEMTQ